MRSTARVAVFLLPFIATSHAAARQTSPPDVLSSITSLKCQFPTYSAIRWTAVGAEIQVRTGTLSFQIDTIDLQGGTARLVGSAGASHITALHSGPSVHFLQNSGPYITLTTVFTGEGSNRTLRAVHVRHQYIEFAVPGFVSEPTAMQHAGHCDAGS